VGKYDELGQENMDNHVQRRIAQGYPIELGAAEMHTVFVQLSNQWEICITRLIEGSLNVLVRDV
jgi:hypothetical protein